MPVQTIMSLDGGKIMVSTIERKYQTMEGEYTGYETLVFLLNADGSKSRIISEHTGQNNLNTHFNVCNRYWIEGLSASELYLRE